MAGSASATLCGRGGGRGAHLGDIQSSRPCAGKAHSLAGFRGTIAGDKQLGEVVRAVGWGDQQQLRSRASNLQAGGAELRTRILQLHAGVFESCAQYGSRP